ncbi:MAG: aspartate kinase [Prevotellaceae bacterium]|jgi:aspartate kinase|nr:aspartate kinase [Prevotellaceae bacterium]
MNVFKFGGASVKDAGAIENTARIIARYAAAQTVVVVSAMGKTTNALEAVLHAWYTPGGNPVERLAPVRKFHFDIMQALFPAGHPVFTAVENRFQQVAQLLAQPPSGRFDFDYDRLVSAGELLSTAIVGAWLNERQIETHPCDARRLIITDDHWREANIDWPATEKAIREKAGAVFGLPAGCAVLLTQGFIGATPDGRATTLGREGSDYTAAIFSYALDAEKMTVWKDVPGVLNADPKRFADTVLLPHISYGEAIELTYYGATVIHPKTIKPLQNKRIPLHVRSFLQPESPGTLITADADGAPSLPSFIVKSNQRLISIAPKDFSFMAEQNLSDIFAAFAKAGVRINMMQNSAISFTACVADDAPKIGRLFDGLTRLFTIKYNAGLTLLTIRHWTPEAIEKMTAGKNILLEQRNRTTIQIVMEH